MSQTLNDHSMQTLRKYLKPGDTVFTQLNHVSRSGMMRAIAVKVIRNNRPIDLTWHVGEVTGYKMSKTHDGLAVGGCGMDMGFHLVYSLSSILFPKGFKVGRKGTRARNGDTSGFDRDGGYALNQEWL